MSFIMTDFVYQFSFVCFLSIMLMFMFMNAFFLVHIYYKVKQHVYVFKFEVDICTGSVLNNINQSVWILYILSCQLIQYNSTV